jgi:hypothetical protein
MQDFAYCYTPAELNLIPVLDSLHTDNVIMRDTISGEYELWAPYPHGLISYRGIRYGYLYDVVPTNTLN